MTRLLTLFLLAIAVWAAPATLLGQYSLSETGWMAAGGASLLQGSQVTVGPAAQLSGFFSHYTCGKRYGFHFAGGLGMVMNRAPVIEGVIPGGPLSQGERLTMGYAFVGAYGKIRPHTYHRGKEFCFLAGPQLEIPFLSTYSADGTSGSMSDAGASVNTLLPGAHLSLQVRRPLGKELSFFIEPGADVQFSPWYSTPVSGNRSLMRFTLALGASFWNDH